MNKKVMPMAEKLNKENELKAKIREQFNKDFEEFQKKSIEKYGFMITSQLVFGPEKITSKVVYVEVPKK